MPRKSSKDAIQDYLKADEYRWRFLARNRLFRKDLCDFLNECGTALYRGEGLSAEETNRRWEKMQQLRGLYLEKWKIDRLPDVDLWPENEELRLTVETLEGWYQAAREENNHFATVDYPAFITKIRRGARLDRMFIEFSLDFRLPIDNLLALMEGELRRYYDRYYWKTYLLRTGQNRGKPPSHDFHLQVYDLMQPRKGEKKPTFSKVARDLRQRSLATIRDAYHAALRKIYSNVSTGEMTNMAGQEPADPGPPSECPNVQCRDARTADEWCYVHKAYYLPEEVPQSELIVKDWSALSHLIDQESMAAWKTDDPVLSSDD